MFSIVIRAACALCASLFLAASLTAFADGHRVVKLATTTSTDNSGLMAYLMPELEKDTGYEFRVIAVGTGKALQLGRAGDVDALLVHARSAELRFIEEGHGVDRREVMYNDFIIVGPDDDPAGAAAANGLPAALRRIAASDALFVSRGDDSGTHKKELALWESAGVAVDWDGYREAGQGMGRTLQIADELQAYTLTDRATWIFAGTRSRLTPLVEGDPMLFNQYGVMSVNPARHDVNHAGARALTEWLVSARGQRLIDAYAINGRKLFHANAR